MTLTLISLLIHHHLRMLVSWGLYKVFFTYFNIIVIITGKSRARKWSWLQDDASQFFLVPFSNASGGKYSMMQGLSSVFRSKLFNGVLLVFSIRSKVSQFTFYMLPQVSLLPPAKLTDDHPLRKALSKWPNKYHWVERGISPQKH